jgi:hypothetical protein
MLRYCTCPVKSLSLTFGQKLAALRNRENQRRSRARRKDYIQELEQRIRQYETAGVKATAEVQAAARKVSEENIGLRSLLGIYGVDNGRIEEFLRTGDASLARREYQQDVALPKRAYGSIENCGSACVKPPPCTAAPHQQVMQVSSITLPHDITPPETVVGTDHTEFLGKDNAAARSQILPVLRNPISTIPNGGDDLQSSSARDEISCLAAAEIIAGMRGHDNPEEIWPELGCSSSKKCMVKNMAIFQIMDQ